MDSIKSAWYINLSSVPVRGWQAVCISVTYLCMWASRQGLAAFLTLQTGFMPVFAKWRHSLSWNINNNYH